VPRISRLFLVFALLFAAAPALAQSSQAPETPAQTPATPALTPEQARRALETLQDDARRAQMIDTLRAIANAPAGQPAPTNADKPAAPPLVAEGLIAQLLLSVSTQIGAWSHQFVEATRAVTHFPLLWHWLVRTATDPSSYDTLIDIAWKLALVLACGLGVEWLIRRAMRRPIAMLEGRARPLARDVAPSDVTPLPGDAAAEPELWRRHISIARLWQALIRFPLVLARFGLEWLPVLGFAVTGTLLLSTDIGAVAIPRLVILAIVNAYVLSQSLICVARVLVSSGPLSLWRVEGETAAYVEIWTTRIVTVGVFGVALANVALLLGLYRAGYHAIVRLVMLAVHLLIVVIILQCRRPIARFIRSADGREGAMARVRNRVAHIWHYPAIAVVLALWVVWALNIRNGYGLLLQYFVGTFVVVALCRVLTMVAVGGIDRLFRINPEFIQRFPGLETRANRYLPLLRRTVSCIIGFVGFVALLEVWGVDAIVWFYSGQIGSRLLSAVLTVGIAALVAAAVWEASNAFMDRQLIRLTREGHLMRAARLRTFMPMLRTALLCVILAVVGLTALSEIGVNVAPLLAGAGIVGIAIGFGSQKLVQDLITGLFLLLENAVQVGDVVTVSGLTGTVENLSIRTVRLRAGDGSIHIIPFSAVTSVTNNSRGMGNAAVSVNVAYKEDTDRVGKLLKEIAAEMRREPDYQNLMRGELDLWGVDKVDGAMASIVGQIPCTDGGRWKVQREFNRRMKRRFQECGIEVATPAQTILMQGPAFAETEARPARSRAAG
jgi:small-conductance mechanosensitive channel